MLGLENLDTPFVENLSKALAIIHEIDSPWLHLYPDIGNLAAAGYHPPDELTLAKESDTGYSRQGCHAASHSRDTV